MPCVQDHSFSVSLEESVVILIGLPLCITWLFFLYCFDLCIECFDYYEVCRYSFLIQYIWCSVGFLYICDHLFLQVRKVLFYNCDEDILWPYHPLLFLLLLDFLFIASPLS